MVSGHEQDDFERFRSTYGQAEHGVFDQIEQTVIGAVYGANGYATRAQVDEMGRRLGLGPGVQLLDLGTGCGWPGLYLATTTGCSVVAADVPMEGLVKAARRAGDDRIDERTSIVAARAEDLPFRARSFDAVTHADVLC